MKSINLSGSARAAIGKKDAGLLRKDANVPCVLYGGETEHHFYLHKLSFRDLVYTPDVYEVNLELGGQKFTSILKDVQFHPITDQILHADFLQLFPDKPVNISIPVRLTGNSVGVRAGGKLVQKLRKVKIKALPKHIPEAVEVDISDLDINQAIKIQSVINDDVQFLDAKNVVIVTVQMTRAAKAEAAAAANASNTGGKKK